MSTKSNRTRRRIMRAFKLTEISAVDSPAQEGARMVLMKRNEDAVDKVSGLADVFTTSQAGHQHGVEINRFGDEGEPHIWVSHASGPDGESHSHDILRTVDGSLVLSENEGHTHVLDADLVTRALMNSMIGKMTDRHGGSVSVAAIIAGTRDPVPTGKSADDLGTQPTEGTMADKNVDTLSADLKKRDEEIALLKAVIDLTPEHRAHYDTLPANRQEDFVRKSHAERSADLEAVEKGNPVIYTDGLGAEYRKSDDPRLVAMAKERDTERDEVAKMRTDAEQATFEKAAETTLGLIPGEKVVKVALVRVISKNIDDEETRGKVLEMLEAANKVYRMALGTQGVSDTLAPANTSIAKAADVLAQAVDACAKAEGISKAKATEKVLATAEGQRLYDAARVERIRSGASSVE